MVSITEVEITNLGMIEYFKAPMGAINLICGANDTGKTTVTYVVKWIFAGGNDPELLRDNCDEGWAKITLSNGYTAEKRLWIKEDGSCGYELKVKTPQGGVKKAPKDFLDELMPPASFDVDAFLNGTYSQKAKFLLGVIPLKFEPEEVNAAYNARRPQANVIRMTERARQFFASRETLKSLYSAPPVINKTINLAEFNELLDLRRSQRTELNRLKSDLEGAMATLQAGRSMEDGTDWGEERDRLSKELGAVRGNISNLELAVKMSWNQQRIDKREVNRIAKGTVEEVISGYVALVENFLNGVVRLVESEGRAWDLDDKDLDKLNELRRQIASRASNFSAAIMSRRELREEMEKFEASSVTDEAFDKAQKTVELQAQAEQLSQELGSATAKADEQQRAIGVRNTILELEEKITGADQTDADLTFQIHALENLKNRKLEKVPIPGFDLKIEKNNPIITIHGRPFERLNQQQQIFTAVRCLRLARGSMATLICEAAELDDDHLLGLAESCKEVGMQMMLARWRNRERLNVKDDMQYMLSLTTSD